MRFVFYHAVIGWFLMAFWIMQLRWRILKIEKYREGEIL
jgi:hypothetical protein